MDIRFVASVAVITADPAASAVLWTGTLGLPLHPPVSDPGSAYLYTEQLPGAEHFGVWPLEEAAEACFGVRTWPPGRPVPQASVELEVDDVAAAAQELQDAGHALLHGPRTEPWGQTVARTQSPEGIVLGLCHTPYLRERVLG